MGPSARSTRSSRAKPSATRSPASRHTDHELLEAALGVFADNSYEAANMEVIAAAANCTKVTVYAHFGSKLGLYDALLERELGVIRAELFAAYERAASRPAREAIAITVEAFIDYSVRHPLGFRWLFGPVNAAVTPKGQALFEVIVGRLAELIRASPQGSARLRTNARLVATMSLSAVTSAAHRALLDGEDPRQVITLASDYISAAHQRI